MTFDKQEFVWSAVIAERHCGIDECVEPVAGTYAMVRPTEPGKVAYEVVWGCSEHRATLVALAQSKMHEGSVITGWAQDIVGDCLARSCDAVATHVVFVARDYGATARRLEGMSLCELPAAAAEEDLTRA